VKKVFLLLFLSSVLVFACKNEPAEPDMNNYSYEAVNMLIITNPSNNIKYPDDLWVKLDYEAEPAENVSTVLKNEAYVERTIPFDTGIFEAKPVNSSRAIISSRAATNYIETETKNIIDTFGNYSGMAELRYDGSYCYVWTYLEEDKESSLDDSEIKAFADKFDSLYEKQIALCGPKYDGKPAVSGIIKNPDKKVSLMLCDIGRDKSCGSVYGYFAPNNYYDNINSNRMEIIFVDSYYVKKLGENNGALFSTIFHEFNHLLNYCNKTLKYGLYCESWYTEMLSMLCEDFFDAELGLTREESVHNRLGRFVAGSYTDGFGNWKNESDSVGKKYANAYAFGAYLARNYGGAALVHEIMTNEYVNEESVVKAVNKINGTSFSFNDLFEGFPLLLANCDNSNKEFPSLNKSTSDKLEGITYELSAINLSDFIEGGVVVTNNPDNASDEAFDSYGFQFYSFPNKAKVSLSIKNFLNHKIY